MTELPPEKLPRLSAGVFLRPEQGATFLPLFEILPLQIFLNREGTEEKKDEYRRGSGGRAPDITP